MSSVSSQKTDRELHADWLEAVANSQSRACYEKLFRYYAPRVKSFMLRHGASETQADEIVQTVMLTVWTKAHQYDRSKAAVSTWIFRIARNRRIDAHRRSLSNIMADVELKPEIIGEDPGPSRDDRLDVSAALGELNDDQTAILRAAYYEGYTHREIAENFDLPMGTVKSRIRLACQKLKTRLTAKRSQTATKISKPEREN